MAASLRRVGRGVNGRDADAPALPVPATSERVGAGRLGRARVVGTPRRASEAEVARAEKKLGTRMPAGYRTFVTALGWGTYGTRVHVRLPRDVVARLAAWRGRIEQYWFWGDAPLPQARALESVCFADTTDGDELLFHPDDADAIWLLPRHARRARRLGRGLPPSGCDRSLAQFVRRMRGPSTTA